VEAQPDGSPKRNGTTLNLTQKIALVKAQREPQKSAPVRMSPYLRRLTEKRLPVRVLWNGAWTPTDEGGAA
jgi:hypothetical protein